MFYIPKTSPPDLIVEWINRRRIVSEESVKFEYLQNPEKEDLRKILLAEQYHLCCYTQLRLIAERSHIEHLIPQSVSIEAGRFSETVSYNNLVAAFSDDEFGARYKSDWPSDTEKSDFVKPTDKSCSERFEYTGSGLVKPADNDTSAQKTIEKLNLNHPRLVKKRRETYLNQFLTVKGGMKKKDLRNKIKFLATPENGKLPEFSFILTYLLKKKLNQ
ncbi:MAG: TIGR02646 family protein [Ignavibacteriaceae bacterium]|nr:TIGR02646 family protein [Ignavibacteriaceae bacterium]